MAGRSARQKGDEVRGIEKKGNDYDIIIKKVTLMEKGIEENSNRWKKIVKEIRGIKESLLGKNDKGTEGEKGTTKLCGRFEEMNVKVTELSGTVENLRKNNDGLKEQNKELKQQLQEIVKENEALHKRLMLNEEKGKEQGNCLVRMQHVQDGWARVQEKSSVDFREVMKQQEEENKINLEKKVIQVIKSKENVVRDMIDKKRSVIIFGLKEKVVTNRRERQEE